MTTTDTLKLYAALHADVPETKPERGDWIAQAVYHDAVPAEWLTATIALCRCAALSFVVRSPKIIRMPKEPLPNEEAHFFRCSRVVSDTIAWMDKGADDDAELIRICREIKSCKEAGEALFGAIHAAKGANRD